MKRSDFEKWYPYSNLHNVYYVDRLECVDGLSILLCSENWRKEAYPHHKISLHWESFLSFTFTEESFCMPWWISSSSPTKAWTFYKNTTSEDIENLRTNSHLCPELLYHFVIVGSSEVVHIISAENPIVSIE